MRYQGRRAAGRRSAFTEFGDRRIDLVQNDETGLIVDCAPVDGADEPDELRRRHMLDGRKHLKQLNQRAGVRTGEHGLALLAVPGLPPFQQPRVVSELLFCSGAAFHVPPPNLSTSSPKQSQFDRRSRANRST